MNGLLRHIVTLFLTIGLFFLTTDCEIYFSQFHPQFNSSKSPIEQSCDVEHTHIAHHLINDLLQEKTEGPNLSESCAFLNGGTPQSSFKNNNYTSIFQPPKYS